MSVFAWVRLSAHMASGMEAFKQQFRQLEFSCCLLTTFIQESCNYRTAF